MILRLSRALKTSLLRVRNFARKFRWILLSGILCVVGVISIWVRIAPEINVLLAIVAIVLFVTEIAKNQRYINRTQFPSRSTDDYRDVEVRVATSHRFELVRFRSGTFVYDVEASRRFRGSGVLAQTGPKIYALPPQLIEVGTEHRDRFIAEHPYSHNGQVLGIDTNFGTGSPAAFTEIRLVRAHYWDYLASDALAWKDVLIDNRDRAEFGRRLFINRKGDLRDFGDSWLVNAIGTSVLAITSDGRLVLVLQSNKNESSGGLFAPSGSGSLEPRDFGQKTKANFADVAANGALRELGEEAQIAPHEVESVHFLGFGRWVEKSGKPEVLSLAFLNVDSHEIHRRQVRPSERPFTTQFGAYDFAIPAKEWVEGDVLSMVDENVQTRLSLPLAASLMLLNEASNSGQAALGRLIRARC